MSKKSDQDRKRNLLKLNECYWDNLTSNKFFKKAIIETLQNELKEQEQLKANLANKKTNKSKGKKAVPLQTSQTSNQTTKKPLSSLYPLSPITFFGLGPEELQNRLSSCNNCISPNKQLSNQELNNLIFK